MKHFDLDIRVRYCETDAMGVLHHSHYVNYFEMGRTEMLRNIGGSYRQMEESGLFLMIVKFECTYKAPAHYDDLLQLRTILKRITPAKMEHDYELYRDDDLLATGRTILACVDKEGMVRRVPDVYRIVESDFEEQ